MLKIRDMIDSVDVMESLEASPLTSDEGVVTSHNDAIADLMEELSTLVEKLSEYREASEENEQVAEGVEIGMCKAATMLEGLIDRIKRGNS